MPKVSKSTVENIADYGAVEDRSSDLAEYTFNFVTLRESSDLGPMLASLPDGNCKCPHWGYLLKGRMIVRYDGFEEEYLPGDAFYMTPGHVPACDAGTEFVMISPAEELKATDAAIAAGMAAQHGAPAKA